MLGSMTGSDTSVCGVGSGTCHKNKKLSAAPVPENDSKACDVMSMLHESVFTLVLMKRSLCPSSF